MTAKRKGIARRIVEAVGNLVRGRRRTVSDESYEVLDPATVKRAKAAAAATPAAAGAGAKKGSSGKRGSKKRRRR